MIKSLNLYQIFTQSRQKNYRFDQFHSQSGLNLVGLANGGVIFIWIFLMRYLYSLVILNSTTIKIKKIITQKEKLSISCSGVTTFGRSCAALSMKSCRWHGARQHQESALLPHPPGAEIWTAKDLLAGMREAPHRV